MMQTTSQNVIVVPKDDGSTYPNYSKKSSLILGIFHLIIVLAAFILSIVGVAVTQNYVKTWAEYDGPNYNGTMVFSLVCCALYLAASICAIVAGLKGNRGVVIASMVLNIIVAIIAVISVIVYVIAIAAMHKVVATADEINTLFNTRTEGNEAYHDFLVAILIICYLTFFLSLAQSIVTIWTSAIGCSVTCCGRTNPVGQPVVMTTTGAPVVVSMHGQQAQPNPYEVSGGYDQPGDYPQQQGSWPMMAGEPLKQ